jgi:hypothetical protein
VNREDEPAVTGRLRRCPRCAIDFPFAKPGSYPVFWAIVFHFNEAELKTVLGEPAIGGLTFFAVIRPGWVCPLAVLVALDRQLTYFLLFFRHDFVLAAYAAGNWNEIYKPSIRLN